MTADDARRALVAEMPDELEARFTAGEEIWNTDQLREDFTVLGFAAPFVVVRRNSDGVQGTLMFTHQPRYYFGFEEST